MLIPWGLAENLGERRRSLLEVSPEPSPADASLANQRRERWQNSPAFAGKPLLATYLESEGLSEAEFLSILGETRTWPGERGPPPPEWFRELEAALTNSSSQAARPPAREPADVFLQLVEPLLARYEAKLEGATSRLIRDRAPQTFGPGGIPGLFLPILRARLLSIIQRSLVLELNTLGIQGALSGDTTEARLAAFSARLCEPDTRLRIFSEYPVLGRLCILVAELWLTASTEFLVRLRDDSEDLRCWMGSAALGELVGIEGGRSETHHAGRSVLIARFATGARVVYKPRPLAVDQRFEELVGWLNARGLTPELRAHRVLDRGAYGWVEYTAQHDCGSGAAVERFYRRQGAWIALFQVIAGRDLHHENVLAFGEHPVMVDLEMLFQPHLDRAPTHTADDEAEESLLASVLSVGLLPSPRWMDGKKLDESGLGGAPGNLVFGQVLDLESGRLVTRAQETGSVHNRPTLDGALLPLAPYVPAVESGFRAAYRLLLQHRDAFLADPGPLAAFRSVPIRTIVRPTARYASLLEESFHPHVLVDALERERLLSQVWGEVSVRPSLRRIAPSELRQLRRNDVPYFSTRPTSLDLIDADGAVIPSALSRTGYSIAEERIRRMGEADLGLQTWIIRASLTSAAGDVAPHVDRAALGPRMDAQAGFLQAARAVGDWLAQTAFRKDGRASWLSMALDANVEAATHRNYRLHLIGEDLYEGMAGVVLFLAYLGHVAGEARYTALAREGLDSLETRWAREPFRQLGAFSGLGGALYLYSHLASLWAESRLLRKAFEALPRLEQLARVDRRLDMIAGAAGCIPVLLGLERLQPDGRALAGAVLCGERLLTASRARKGRPAWSALEMRRGFSHGPAGLAFGLGELYRATGEQRFAKAARSATRFEEVALEERWTDLQDRQEEPQSTWCHGAAGIALGRLLLHRALSTTELQGASVRALEAALRGPPLESHSLCHGKAGNLETFRLACEVFPADARWRQAWQAQSEALLTEVRQGCRSALPNHIETPGLMLGLSGVGYGLLRCAAPQRVPSVLTLAPPA